MNLHYAGLGMDYMISLATLAKGYSPNHVIDVVPFVGVTAGWYAVMVSSEQCRDWMLVCR